MFFVLEGIILDFIWFYLHVVSDLCLSLWFLCCAIFLITLYHRVKFQSVPFDTFGYAPGKHNTAKKIRKELTL